MKCLGVIPQSEIRNPKWNGPGQDGQRHIGPRTAYRTFGLDADGPADVGAPGNDAARATKSEPRTSVSGWI